MDDTKRVLFKGMQYFGPVCMGFGAFAMIIACVMTLESRDRHAQVSNTRYIVLKQICKFQIIQEESSEYRKLKNQIEADVTKTSLLSPFDETVEIVDEVGTKNTNKSKGESTQGKLFWDGNGVLDSYKLLIFSSNFINTQTSVMPKWTYINRKMYLPAHHIPTKSTIFPTHRPLSIGLPN